MDYQNLIVEYSGAVATITFNRPKALNAINRDVVDELAACCAEIAAKTAEIRAVIVTGAGKAFIAGADIAYMRDLAPLAARDFALAGQKAIAALENLPQPVIGAINGFALGGGCETALACDFRIASETAKFGQPEVNLGILPGFGGSQRLPRLIGKGLAAELLFTGNIIDAQEACRIGLVNRVVAADQLMAECKKLAEHIASRGPVAVRLCKEAVNKGLEMGLEEGCYFEADSFGLCCTSPDQKEGMSAFLEKRPAKFVG
ncbi:MAG: enoyl-CoA hydratase/isomerase family protein [Desulfobulbaceae bacterium]|jgi:enoyl-CoA hydratase|nr:enoyl-CoA hydratase/isomerase family protein [Desulfobulbaceae bacterium]